MPSPPIPRASLSSSSSSSPNISNIGPRRRSGLPTRAELLALYRPPAIKNRARTRTNHRLFARVLLGRKTEKNPHTDDLASGSGCAVKKGSLQSFLDEESTPNILKKADSPYYRGLLTNASPPFYYNNNFSEPAHSHAASTTFSKSSLASTIITKIQEYGNSCFQFRAKKGSDEPPRKEASPAGLRNRDENDATASAAAASSSPPPLVVTEAKSGAAAGGSEEKPLRESVPCHYSGPADHDDDDDQAVPQHNDQHEPIVRASQPSEGAREMVLVGGAGDGKPASKGETAVREFRWADKYRPEALEDFICNKSKADQLHDMTRNKESCGHFIFQGPPGVGKRTMIWAMIREAFGPDCIQAREEFKVFNFKVVGSVKVLVKESPLLLEVNLSEVKGYEKHVIFELIRETSLKISNNSALPRKPQDNCRAIIFYGVDKLSTDEILYIKWLLERFKVRNNIFFCCTDVSRLQAIKSLCTVVHLLPPSRTEIIKVLKLIAEKEGIDLPDQLAEKITETSKNNLRQAIRSFEATWLKHYPFKEDQEVLTGWEDDIADIAKKMVHEQSPKQLYVIRGKLQDLGEHDMSPEFIFQSLVDELKKHLDDLLKGQVHSLYLEYNKIDENMFEDDKAMMAQTTSRKIGIQQFLRIEEFIAKFMSFYKAGSTKSAQHDSHNHYH